MFARIIFCTMLAGAIVGGVAWYTGHLPQVIEQPATSQEVRTNLQSPSGEPHILAAYQPWFGRDGHINVGYSTQDPGVLQRQVREAAVLFEERRARKSVALEERRAQEHLGLAESQLSASLFQLGLQTV